MKEVSLYAYETLKSRLTQLEEELAVHVVNLGEARAKGDLRENSEYIMESREFTLKSQERDEIEQRLKNITVRQTYSNTIESGTIISITNLDTKEDLGLFMFDLVGLYVEGKITPDDPLGHVIRGGSSGNYSLKHNGKVFNYRITVEPESKTADFMEKYPSDNFLKILDGS